MVHTGSDLLALTSYNAICVYHGYRLLSSSAANWFIKGCAMCYHVYMIMHVKDPQLFLVRVGHGVLVAILVYPYISCMMVLALIALCCQATN